MVDWSHVTQELQNQQGTGRRANVKFFVAYNLNPVKSANEGKPVYDEIESISIKFPGMDETCRRVEQQDKANYPKEWEAYKSNTEAIAEGTPLVEWAMLPASAAKELNFHGFYTVEQLAEAPDAAKARIGTLAQFVSKAISWVEAANSDANKIVSLEAAIEHERERSRKLEAQMEVLIQRVNANEGTDLKMEKEVEKAPSTIDKIEAEVAQATKRGRKRKGE